jgi:hypothetical protein
VKLLRNGAVADPALQLTASTAVRSRVAVPA